MRIISLQAENIKQLKAVSITFNAGEPVHVIGGDNGAGKSSVLDAIMIALQQAGAHPPEPIRRGKKSGKVTLDLGDLRITRELHRGRSPKLTVIAKDGTTQKRPQQLLDELCSKIAFDPLAFLQLRGPEQKQQLRDLLSDVDWAALDAEEAELFARRRDVARDAKRLRAQLDGMAPFDEPLAPPPDVQALLGEQRRIQQHNAEGERLRRALADAEQLTQHRRRQAAEIEQQIAELRRQLELAQQYGGEAQAAEQLARRAAENHADLSEDEIGHINQRIAQASQAALDYDRWKATRKHKQETLAAEKEAEQLTADIEQIRSRREQLLEAAEFPVPGLSFGDDGVLLNGLPLSQASQAEQIRVSVAIAMKLNPKLPTALIRHGSLMRDASIDILRQEVAAAGGQCLLEHALAPDGECAVVMVDGEARQS